MLAPLPHAKTRSHLRGEPALCSESNSLTAELPRKNRPSRKYILSGSRPAWAATGIRCRSPRRPSQASRTCCWARFPGLPKGPPAQSGSRLRERRRLPEVLVQAEKGKARSVRSGGRRLHSQREDQERGLLGGAGNRTHRPASRSRPTNGLTAWLPRRWRSSPAAPAPPTVASMPWKAIPPAAWVWPITWDGTGNPRRGFRS